MKVFILFVSFLISFEGFSFDFPQECINLLIDDPEPKARVNYRLNFDTYFPCLKAFQRSVNEDPLLNHEVSLEVIHSEGDGLDIYRMEFVPRGLQDSPKILLTAGIHGNEAIGPAVLVDFLRDAVQSEAYAGTSFRVYPMLNPWGLKKNKRRNQMNVDLNRELKPESQFPLFEVLRKDLQGESFHLGLDIHEAGGHDFFLLANDALGRSFAQRSLSSFPLEKLVRSPTGNYPYKKENSPYTFYSPGVGSSDNKGTVKAFMKDYLGVPLAFTTESPLSMELEERRRSYKDFLIALMLDSNKS